MGMHNRSTGLPMLRAFGEGYNWSSGCLHHFYSIESLFQQAVRSTWSFFTGKQTTEVVVMNFALAALTVLNIGLLVCAITFACCAPTKESGSFSFSPLSREGAS